MKSSAEVERQLGGQGWNSKSRMLLRSQYFIYIPEGWEHEQRSSVRKKEKSQRELTEKEDRYAVTLKHPPQISVLHSVPGCGSILKAVEHLRGEAWLEK